MSFIPSNVLTSLIFILFSSLLTSAFFGFALLKFYEEFRKGVEQKSRLRVWFAFFGISFMVILFVTLLVKGVK